MKFGDIFKHSLIDRDGTTHEIQFMIFGKGEPFFDNMTGYYCVPVGQIPNTIIPYILYRAFFYSNGTLDDIYPSITFATLDLMNEYINNILIPKI